MIIGPSVGKILQVFGIALLGEELVRVVENGFGLQEFNDVSYTAVQAIDMEGEADVQIEIRYTAGEDEYDRGEPFDPSKKEQEALAENIREVFTDHCINQGLRNLYLSVWFKPYYKGFFKMYTSL